MCYHFDGACQNQRFPRCSPIPHKQETTARYTIDRFLVETRQKDHGEGMFELEGRRILELNLNGPFG